MAWWWKMGTGAQPREGAPRSPEGVGAPAKAPPRKDADAGSLLARCCEERVPAVLMWPDVPRILHGVFHSLDDRTLSFIVGPAGVRQGRPMSQCCVSFVFEGQIHMLIAFEHTGREDDHTRDWVMLSRPSRVLSETRVSFRVPVTPSADLAVSIAGEGGAAVEVEALDISVSGMQVAFPSARDPGTGLGQCLTARLRRNGTTLSVRGEVRRREEIDGTARCGILFHNELNGFPERVEPLLANLVREIERVWIKERAHT